MTMHQSEMVKLSSLDNLRGRIRFLRLSPMRPRQQLTPTPTMASTTEHNTEPNASNNIRNYSEEQNRDTLGANGVTGEEREVTRRAQAEAEDEPREDETSNISLKIGRGRPRKAKSDMIMQAGMVSIARTQGRPRKDKTISLCQQ
jgi:hypothetical protein